MQDYSVAFINTDGVVFPGTTAINATGPSTTDGTEFVKSMIDDAWGARQAIMDHAGLIPDGVTEAVGTAQMVEALQKGFGAAPGMITASPTFGDPSAEGYRCFPANGQGVLVANYGPLVANKYVGDGNNAAAAAGGGAYYKSDDAAGTIPNTAGIYFIIPETRGVVARGLDLAGSIDPDGASRVIGDLQADAFQGHWHTEKYSIGGASGAAVRITDPIGGSTESQSIVSPVTDGVNGTPRTSSESRMYNRSENFVQWY